MITAVDWRGELDGDVVLTLLDDEGASSEVVIDRPGDLVSRMMASDFAEDDLLLHAAAYGFCLASRGIEEPIFIDQIVRKSGAFLRSARMESLPLYRLVERLTVFGETTGTRGVALREAMLAEAHRLRTGAEPPEAE